jgi:hypothetical protein
MVEREPTSFATNAIDRDDLVWCRPELEAQIRSLDADELRQIALAVGELLQDEFWSAVRSILSQQFDQATDGVDEEVDMSDIDNDNSDPT